MQTIPNKITQILEKMIDPQTPFLNTKAELDEASVWLKKFLAITRGWAAESNIAGSGNALEHARENLNSAVSHLHNAGYERVEDGGENIPGAGWRPHVKDVPCWSEAIMAEMALIDIIAPFTAVSPDTAACVAAELIDKITLFLPEQFQDTLNDEQEYIDSQVDCFV